MKHQKNSPITRIAAVTSIVAAVGIIAALNNEQAEKEDAQLLSDASIEATATPAASVSASASASATARTSSTPSSTSTATPVATPAATSAAASTAYKDGSYTVDGNYSAPGGFVTMSVSFAVANDTITAVNLTSNARGDSKEYVDNFVSAYKASVVGKKIDQVSLTRVAGSSLTTRGFNTALSNLKAESKS